VISRWAARENVRLHICCDLIFARNVTMAVPLVPKAVSLIP
jgi:hypothetical protein